MPCIEYVSRNFSALSEQTISQANAIITEYAGQGFDLTLRQLYYQFVARGLIQNTERDYKRLGSIINDARLAGLIDWSAIQDRTRNLQSNTHWSSPAEIIRAAATSYRRDMWATQPCRPEVWVEKDAMIGVIEGICQPLDVPYFSCRGYTSQSEMWAAGRRLHGYCDDHQQVVILYFGDHDPSGIDMSRDITDRIEMFTGGLRGTGTIEIRRVALNMAQVRRYRPPPNPAKLTDSRVAQYIRLHGNQSWELDALDPRVIATLIKTNIEGLRDVTLWNEAVTRAEREQASLTHAADNWSKVEKSLAKRRV